MTFGAIMKMNEKKFPFICMPIVLGLIFGSCCNIQAFLPFYGDSYFVSTTGNDANPGTILAPFQTITKAIEVSEAGYTIYVRAGTYPYFVVKKNNLTIIGYPGEKPLIHGGEGIQLLGSYITLSGFEVTSMTGKWSAGIVSFGENNIVRDNVVHDNTYDHTNGILVVNGSYNQIVNNVVYNNNKFGIGVYGPDASNNVISGNAAYDHTLSAGDSDGIHCSGNSTGNTFVNNTTYDNSDDGLDTWDCVNNLVSNNVSHHNGGTGDGNGFKLGAGGGNIVKGNVAYLNYACGFTSNGAGNYYEDNISYSNMDCGFDDQWRVFGNTQSSSFINNTAYDNSENFITGIYTTVFVGNSEVPILPGLDR